MYQIGERVVYGIQGICRVVCLEKQIINKEPVTYLVLEPVAQEGARYFVPTNSAAGMAKLRPMLDAQTLKAMLSSQEVREVTWIADDNLRKKAYRELISSGDCLGLMRMLRMIYLRRDSQAAAGRKVHQADDNFLRDAEKLLISEIAEVLELRDEEAKRYLRRALNGE